MRTSQANNQLSNELLKLVIVHDTHKLSINARHCSPPKKNDDEGRGGGEEREGDGENVFLIFQ